MPSSLFVIIPILLIILVVLAATIKIVKEYERGVVFRLGRLRRRPRPRPHPADARSSSACRRSTCAS